MKISEILLEAPYLLSGDHYDPTVEYFNNISSNALKRDYDHIGAFPINIGGNRTSVIELHLLKSDRSVMLGTVTGQKSGAPTNVVLARLEFKEHLTLKKAPDGVTGDTIKQVGSVYLSDRVRNFGIASHMYSTMVKMGYVILSDRDQFESGKQLWKKIARESLNNNYVAHIVDDNGDYVTDDSGKILAYDDTNISESKIWTSGDDVTGEHILLMMKEQQ